MLILLVCNIEDKTILMARNNFLVFFIILINCPMLLDEVNDIKIC